jgi:hypothetical protein
MASETVGLFAPSLRDAPPADNDEGIALEGVGRTGLVESLDAAEGGGFRAGAVDRRAASGSTVGVGAADS